MYDASTLARIELGADGLPLGWPQDHGIPTLGPQVLAWAEVELIQPDGPHAGGPWRWRESQGRFICWWYALTPSGGFLYRRGQVVMPKGSGKSPLAAALSLCELAGPVHFCGWSEDGEPIADRHPSPWVQLAAVSRDQTDNTMSLAIAMVGPDSPARLSIVGLDPGLARIRTAHGTLQPVTASSTSREGQRSTSAILDETHLWQNSNNGLRLARTIRRNLAKMSGRSLETTNAWAPGEGSVAEATADYAAKVAAGEVGTDTPEDLGVLRWHPQPIGFTEDDMADRPRVLDALRTLYADAPWVSTDRLAAEIMDLNQDPQDSLRYYLNIVTAASSSWISRPRWQACIVDDGPRPGDKITLGFDGSRGRARGKPDATALIGCRVSDGLVFELGVWEAPEDKRAWDSWTPPIVEIEAAIRQAFKDYRVAAFYADPGKDWRSHVNAWEAQWGHQVTKRATRDHPFEWWMTGGRAGLVQQAVEDTEGAIRNRDLRHLGEYRLTAHVLAAHRRLSHGKLALGKEHDYSERKIDAAVAMVLAWRARQDALAAGDGNRQPWFAPARIR